jgi:hypothetical protein
MRSLHYKIRSPEDAMVFISIKIKVKKFIKFPLILFIISDKCLVFSTNKINSFFLYRKIMSNYKLVLKIVFQTEIRRVKLQQIGIEVSLISCFLLFSAMMCDLEFCTVLMLTKAKKIH